MSRKAALTRLHKQLVAKRDALRKQMMTDLNLAQVASQSSDLGEAANTGSQSELHSQLAALESRDLHQIERAIARIREGRYGQCEMCETRIPVTRLKALPFTTFCIDCQQKRERSGRLDEDERDWESVFEYEGSHSQKEITLGDIDIDLN